MIDNNANILQYLLNFITEMYKNYHPLVASLIILFIIILLLSSSLLWVFGSFMINKDIKKKTDNLSKKEEEILEKVAANNNILIIRTHDALNDIRNYTSLLMKHFINISEENLITLTHLFIGSDNGKDFSSNLKRLIFSYYEKSPLHRESKELLKDTIDKDYKTLVLYRLNSIIYDDILLYNELYNKGHLSINDIINNFVDGLYYFDDKEKEYQNIINNYDYLTQLKKELNGHIESFILLLRDYTIDCITNSIIIKLKNDTTSRIITTRD